MTEDRSLPPDPDFPDAAESEETLPAAEPAAEAARAGEVVDFRDRWLRAEAELQNFRRRAVRDLEESRRSAEDRVLLELIGLVDDLERALEAMREADAPETWTQGVALTAQRARDALARNGVVPVEAVGQPFDPSVHEAMLEVDAPHGVAPGSVAQQVERGWRRGPRALRPARVVVARTPAGA